VLASGGTGALLVSLFNMEWGCYAQAGGVEVLEFCLFLVVFPVRCISSIPPRFYFRKHAFCFLSLVAILESLISLSVLSFIFKIKFADLENISVTKHSSDQDVFRLGCKTMWSWHI
jgi:hypothetical protein